ncbi:hypothetical protein ACFQ88_34040 [Paenibacillus sp. NPDC056579]|uniref:hypothetical protein n=1 Tax=Paenibacillus sp. NPDC056579 TaxID=3345871 RepID=UPI003684C133
MSKRRGTLLAVSGILLILFSVYPMFLLVRESVLEAYINSKYQLDQMININNQSDKTNTFAHDPSKPIFWNKNIIEVLTEDTGIEAPKSVLNKFDKEAKHIMKIVIRVNGKEVSSPTEAWLFPNITKFSNYLSWLNIIKVTDKKSNEETIAIIRRHAGNWTRGDTQSQKMEHIILG